MKFSEQFNITRTKKDDWYDPVLSIDTQLFIDPFLIYSNEKGVFEGSHEEVIDFFNSTFKLIARSRGDKKSTLWKKSVYDLRFPEMEELCLGYTGQGTGGLGSGMEFANLMADAMWEAIEAGTKELSHFEEIGILRSGIGPDRISDTTARILLNRLAAYTEEICRRHSVPMASVNYPIGRYDSKAERWVSIKVNLPKNPYNGKPILLIPEYYLRDLPTVNADDFWTYCTAHASDVLRTEMNYDISKGVSKEEIIAFARKHAEVRQDYLLFREKHPTQPYNQEKDPQGLVQWYSATGDYVENKPLHFLIKSNNDFFEVIEKTVEEYRHFIEENGGWYLLWNNDSKKPKHERAAQLTFLGIAKHYCAANDIDLTREAEVGRGPVDFKVSRGHQLRALLEVKLARNSRFWNGLRNQLPTYQKAEKIQVGYFIVIVFDKKDREKIRGIEDILEEVKKKTKYDIKVVVIDAGNDHPSASKIK